MANKSVLTIDAVECAIDVDGVGYEVNSWTPPGAAEWSKGGGAVGSRFRPSTRRTKVKHELTHTLNTNVTIAEAQALLALFFSGTPSTGAGVFTGYSKLVLPSDPAGASTCDIYVDENQTGNPWKFSSNLLSKLTLEFSEGNPVVMEAEFICQAEPAQTSHDMVAPTDATQAADADTAFYFGADRYYPKSLKITFDLAYHVNYQQSVFPRVTGAGEFICSGEVTVPVNADNSTDLILLANTNTALDLSVVTASGGLGFGVDAEDIIFEGEAWAGMSGEGELVKTLPFHGYNTDGAGYNGYSDAT